LGHQKHEQLAKYLIDLWVDVHTASTTAAVQTAGIRTCKTSECLYAAVKAFHRLRDRVFFW
jgi:hypothetical protein